MKSWKAVLRTCAKPTENMARPKKNMSITKVPVVSQQAARKRFKITFGKALQNAPGRTPQPAGSEPKPVLRLPAKPAPPPPSALSSGQDDYLAKAGEGMGVVKTQSGVDLT